jgi:hypothetical protein
MLLLVPVVFVGRNNSHNNFITTAYAQQPPHPPTNNTAECPVKSVQHWDKIIFSIASPTLANKLNLSANTELDIKVRDDPRLVSDLKQKVLNFLNVPNENKSSIKILDVEYAIICAALRPSDNLLVLSPAAFQTSSFDYVITPDQKYQITVTFNKPVDVSSVIPGSSLILETERNSPAQVMLSWSAGNAQLTITTVRTNGDLCSFDPDCFFTLRLDGMGPGVITAADGSLLNGGTQDYWTTFLHLG